MKSSILDSFITNNILLPKYVYSNIGGAPVQIGERVKIIECKSFDDTFEEKYIGWSGVVIFLEYDCGCCQTYPDDPMIGIRFSNNEVFEFWKEELIIL